MSRRTLLYLAVAVTLVVGATLASRRSPEPEVASSHAPATEPSASASDLSAPFPIPAPPPPTPFRRPASSVAEYGVLTTKTEDQLKPLRDRSRLAALITPDLCGNGPACEALKGLLRDEEKTSVEVFASSVWNAERIDVDASAHGLSAADRASISRLPRVVAVRVSAPTGPAQMALRTALATTAALARATGGLVWDQLLERIETPADFAKHAVTTPLDAPCFRHDRVDILYEPKSASTVRVLTSGLSRWGAPDVEAAAVPTAASARVAEIVLAAGQAIADGAQTGPLALTRDDLASARGERYPVDAGLPAPSTVELDVVTVAPENGDPNDFIVRIVPPAGEGPIAYIDLAERFFGRLLAASPGDDVLDARRSGAQAKLSASLAKWDASRAAGAKLVVLVPFAIPGDAGTESMWLEVTRYDARSVTGVVMDEPLGATDVSRGSTVTRPRGDVEDLELRGGKP